MVCKSSGIASYVVVQGSQPWQGMHTQRYRLSRTEFMGTPSIVVDNVNGLGIVTFPGQGSKMRFDFDATGDIYSTVGRCVCMGKQY